MAADPSPSDNDTPPRRRGGRPPADKAGDVDRRILDAATSLFLRQGFDATSCDQVAALAGAGKASIYARYANKEALFTAVVRQHVAAALAPSIDIPWHLPLEARLAETARSILAHSLRPEVVALMRVVLTTAHRMPDLAQLADRMGRDVAIARAAAAMLGHPDPAPEAMAGALPVAATFIDLVFARPQMRALMGDDTAALEAAAPAQVAEVLDLLSRAGRLEPWR